MKIAVIGLWHLGEIYSACLAELGHTIVGIGEEKDVIENLNKGIPPLPEPKLSELLKKNLKNKRLFYTTEYSNIKGADIVWITHDTPVDRAGIADTRIIFTSIQRALPYLITDAVIAVSSQLPVGTSRKIIALLKKKKIGYAYIPENLRLGEGVDVFMNPERVVVGASDEGSAKKIKEVLKKLPAEYIVTNPPSAEMVKHALNAFLATSLSFIYDIADIAEREGADIVAISKALKSDSRIGTKAYLDASLGFSGWSLGRDLHALLLKAREHGTTLPVIAAVDIKNKNRRDKIFERLKALGTLKGKKIAILGLTYKAGTTTLRRSMPLEIAEMLRKKGASITLYDPAIAEEAVRKVFRGSFTYGSNLQDALSGAHAAVLITPWKEIDALDWKHVKKKMKSPHLFFDTRNFFASKSDTISKLGFTYVGIGR